MSKTGGDFVPAALQLTLDRKAIYQECFGTSAGKRVLRDIYEFTGINRECFDPAGGGRTEHNLGRRRVGLHIALVLGESEDSIIERWDEENAER